VKASSSPGLRKKWLEVATANRNISGTASQRGAKRRAFDEF